MDRSGTFVALMSALVVAGCGAGGGNNAAAAPDANKAAPANLASGAVPPASGPPCTHRTRNWRAIVQPGLNPGQGPELSVEGEVEPDSQGRTIGFMHSPFSQPPLLIVQSDRDPIGQTRDWMPTGMSIPDDPAYTRVEVRCGGTVLARLAITRPPRAGAAP